MHLRKIFQDKKICIRYTKIYKISQIGCLLQCSISACHQQSLRLFYVNFTTLLFEVLIKLTIIQFTFHRCYRTITSPSILLFSFFFSVNVQPTAVYRGMVKLVTELCFSIRIQRPLYNRVKFAIVSR